MEQRRREAAAIAARQLLITDLLDAVTPTAEQRLRQAMEVLRVRDEDRARAEGAAVAEFWALLADFVACGAAPPAWLRQIPPDHPFICTEPAASEDAAARIVLARDGA